MKVLLATDIHDSFATRDWLAKQSKQCDILALGGDLLNGLEDCEGLDQQFLRLRDWLISLPCPVALTCGNHDANGTGWFEFLRTDRVLTSGESREFHGLIATAIPWESEHSSRSLFEVGAQLRRQTKLPWLVLNHAPLEPDSEITDLVEDFSPTIVLTGHIHDRPFREGRSVAPIGLSREVFPGRHPEFEPACVWDTATAEVADLSDTLPLQQPVKLRRR